jgi:predicted negative regulator of RcsB-dependent stress response
MPIVVSAAVVLVLLVGGLIYWNTSSTHADSALGAALDTYDAVLAQPGAPAESGVFSSASERSKAANQKFAEVAKQYGWLSQGAKAHYFEGLTDQELGQNAPAESELKIAAGSWDRNLSNLAKIALASLYHQTGRDSEAVDLYNAVAAKPSETVTVGMAQLNLAGMYASEGKMDQARELWAKVKDGDKDGAAGQIATQKLAGRQ